jgi:hypothetical protein
MEIDDKVCEQVSLSMLEEVYPQEVIERCVQARDPWARKERRVRQGTVVSLVLFVMAMALWSRRNQCQVWQSLVGKRERSAPSGAPKYHQRFRPLGTTQATGQPGSAGTYAGALSGAGPAGESAGCLLWTLSAHGY